MFELTVNGIKHQVDVVPEMPLLWVLRDELGITSPKYGCGIAQCGACTVQIDGAAVRSCQARMADVAGKAITTLEAVGNGKLHPVQEAWIEHQVPQCGYCQAGQIIQAISLLKAIPKPNGRNHSTILSWYRHLYAVPMTEVFFEILTPLPLNRRQDARALFQLWADNAFQFLPNRWGLYEPLRNDFSLSTLDEAIRTWEYAYHVKRTASPKLNSSIFMHYGALRDHTTWTIGLKNAKDFQQPAFCKLLECAASVFSADFGFIHRTTDAEMSRGKASNSIGFLDSAHTEKNLFLTTHSLNKCLPDIYWTTAFGKPYVELFSRERLLSCPAHSVKELDNGSIVIQLTPELKDIAAKEAAFERARQDARNHLDNDAFFDPAKGLDHQYKVPEFVWGPVLH